MIIDLLRDLFGGDDYQFGKITPEYLFAQKMKLGEEKYLKWLLKQATICQSIIYMRQEEKSQIPQMWLDKITLIENERDKVQKNRR